jgi:diphthine-ammonia ligase
LAALTLNLTIPFHHKIIKQSNAIFDKMKLGVLFSGGKDSVFAAYLAKKEKNELSCLITLQSKNPESYMFHTPSISQVKKQAEAMNIPIIIQETKGEKEKELSDLKKAIINAKKTYKIEGIITGALASNYQAERIQKICDSLKLKVFNPLWKKNQIKLLEELLKNNFEIIITGIAAYPLDKTWIGRKIDSSFIKETKELQEKYRINPAGEGGEFETLVLDCPLFKKKLKIKKQKISGSGNSFQMEVLLE